MNREVVIVIPARAEPNLSETIQSLLACHSVHQLPIRIVVHINASETDAPEVHSINSQNRQLMDSMGEEYPFISSIETVYPPKRAGVGLARKDAMEHVLFTSSLDPDGVALVNLDADCTVSENYLVEIDRAFTSGVKAGSIHFKHPTNAAGMIAYELLLRYQVNGYRYVGLPGAFHTIGSSFMVSGDVYRQVGGMNARKAGEDFYFLHKVMAQTRYVDLIQPTVYPSDRTSWRVPFGTGKAMSDLTSSPNSTLYAYNPKSFEAFKQLYQSGLEALEYQQVSDWMNLLSPVNRKIAWTMGMKDWWVDAVSQSGALGSAQKRFTRRFYGFNVIKIMHLYRDLFFLNQPIENTSSTLVFKLLGSNQSVPLANSQELLQAYRMIDSRQIEISQHGCYGCR